MSQASPYLLSLGISKSQVALVLMAGPLSGLFTQPIVGLYGDRNPHRLGRRRPFVIYGGLCVLVSLFTFAWCKELAALIIHTGTPAHQSLSALLAVIAFYALDISINIVTVSNKCLIIDVLPSLEQQLANAYASRFSGVSAILTMLISLVDLPSLFGVSSSQLKMISFIGGPIFLVSHLAMCLTVHEARFVADDGGGRGRSSMVITATLRRFWEAWRALDGTIVKPICWIQLWAWLGWFPVMFYSTTWIGETWTRRSGATGPDEEKATRIGTIGLLVQAVLSLLGWLFIPRIVSAFRKRHYGRTSDGGKTLIDLWGGGQICFGFMLLISPFCEDSVALSIGLIGACGIPWAITCWVPFTLLGESLLHKAELATPAGNGFRLLPDTNQQPVSPRDQIVSSGHHSSSIPLKPMSEGPARSSSAPDSNAGTKPMIHVRKSEESEEEGVMEDEYLDGGVEREDEGSQLAGTVLGIHNVFIVLPQFLISCLSSVLFKLLESDQPPSSSAPKTRGVSEIGMIFRLGGVASLVSGLFCWKLGRLIHKQSLSS
ncbi:hypothetical protein PTTG_12028 [Puccinia triticina 1-1 BBBD Race 1]|uniref:General alpha-glucoside permease n=1 Tax=Puccinia triticina (isolate 1-1 / race 1 (BBBD)) TaxID=630390 RepID=A0A180GED5_PUCT1|nr:hypothetical protein PTTG_12028 [Puccinia triticina 1-1 BBBD Race 1]